MDKEESLSSLVLHKAWHYQRAVCGYVQRPYPRTHTQSQEQGRESNDLTGEPGPATSGESDRSYHHQIPPLSQAHLVWISAAKSLLILVQIIMHQFTSEKGRCENLGGGPARTSHCATSTAKG